MIMKTFTTNDRGFTLLEALVAIAIVALSIAGPLYAANRALVAAQIARDKLTASYLAQEGVESVHAMRDNEFLKLYSQGLPTESTLDNLLNITIKNYIPFGYTFDIDPALNSLIKCDDPVQKCPLYLNNGQYTPIATGGALTRFSRDLKVIPVTTVMVNGVPVTTEVSVTSTVSWNFHNILYTVSSVDHLTSWQ
jgi:prepilin-type N-terminal cleavage/methylation domain-containing protein